MPFNRLSTAKIAKAVGCHPNTVRLYEQWGLISPVARSPKGYRLYTEAHLDQMRLGRMALIGAYPGSNIRRSLFAIVRQAAAQDYTGTLNLAHHHQGVVRSELDQAEAAVDFLRRWVCGETEADEGQPLQTQQVARLLDVTIDKLRSWERNGLISIPRSLGNGYRQFRAPEIGRLRVIRFLRQSGYSPMAILRMLVEFDRSAGSGTDRIKWTTDALRRALDTPREDEDVYCAADRWISTLTEHERRAGEILQLVEEMARKYSQG